MSMLTPEQVQFYRDNGYIVASNVISKDELSNLQKITDDFIEQSRSVTGCTDVFDVEDSHTPQNPRLRRLMKPELRHPDYAALFKHPGLIKVLQQLLGPAVRHKGLKMNLKPPGGGEPVEWHQDWAYYPHTNDDLCVLAIMLDDVTLENGPMMVVPGTHKGPIYDHHQDGLFAGAVTQNMDEELKRAVPVTGKAGDISVHHARTLHGSSHNYSNNYRRLLFITARAADAWPIADKVDFSTYDDMLLVGEPCEPRLADVPVRLPFPAVTYPGQSIFVKQAGLKNSPFRKEKEKAKENA
jgi:ectoine hydroxylase-related dioxygenase (phytanoyl-CoA dioxygenase family)